MRSSVIVDQRQLSHLSRNEQIVLRSVSHWFLIGGTFRLLLDHVQNFFSPPPVCVTLLAAEARDFILLTFEPHSLAYLRACSTESVCFFLHYILDHRLTFSCVCVSFQLVNHEQEGDQITYFCPRSASVLVRRWWIQWTEQTFHTAQPPSAAVQVTAGPYAH